MLPATLHGSPSQYMLPICILSYVSTALAQNGDGGAAGGVQNQAGNEGPSEGSFNLSKGAMIAIGLCVGLAVVLGSFTAVLYYLAKKRQWEVRKSIRRTATRVVQVMTPRTPRKMTFSPVSTRSNRARFSSKGNEDDGDDDLPMRETSREKNSDLEKGRKPKVTPLRTDGTVNTETSSGVRKPKSRPDKIQIPSSEFEMDSPKTPMLAKIFGRA